MYAVGVFQAFIVALVIAIYNVYVKISSHLYDVEPIVFTCSYLIATAFSLSLFAGPGKFVTDTIKSAQSWIYGIVMIAVFATDVYLVKYMSGTEVSILSRIATPIAMILVFMIFRRKPALTDMISLVTVFFCSAMVIILQPVENRSYVILIAMIAAIFHALDFLTSETHKQSKKANEDGTIKDKARVVAFVLFVTSLTFLVVSIGLSLLKESAYFADIKSNLYFIPNMSDYKYAPSIITGGLFGLILSPIIRYCQWSAIYKIKTENLMTILALIPFLTFVVESITNLIPALNTQSSGVSSNYWILFLLTAIMAVGSFLSAYLKVSQSGDYKGLKHLINKIKNSMVDKSNVVQKNPNLLGDYDLLRSTMEYTNQDIKKAADLLNVTVESIHVILESKGTLSFTDEVSIEVSQNYIHNITEVDFLTGLKTKSFFNLKLKELISKKTNFTLLYLDLNKFKPVNDTHGHNIGDEVLKKVGKRLLKLSEDKSLVARLGGDEFAFISIKDEDVKDIKSKILSAIEKPIKVLDNLVVEVSTSIGEAFYPLSSSDEDELVEIADKNMLAQKK